MKLSPREGCLALRRASGVIIAKVMVLIRLAFRQEQRIQQAINFGA